MAIGLIPIAVGGGAVAYVAAKRGQTPAQTPEVNLQAAIDARPELGNGTQPGATTTQLRNLGTAFTAKRNAIMGGSAPTTLTTDNYDVSSGLWGLEGPTEYGEIDRALQEKLDLIKKYGQAAYDKLSDDAKKASAKALSEQLDLDPPLDGSESWSDIAAIAGGAAGLAAFGWLPGGAVWGPIVGTYLGVKLEELISKNSDEIKQWFSDKWGDIEEWVKDAGHEVSDWFGEIF